MAELTPDERAFADQINRALGGDGMLPDLYYFDRAGNRITAGEQAVLWAREEYRRVAYDEVGPYEVSTAWLGLDHGWTRPDGYDGPLATFETAVRGAHDDPYDITDRWPTEEAALLGHASVLKQVQEHVANG